MAVGTSGRSPSGAAGSAWRVLVVEDEYYIADDIRQDLEAQGAQIVGPIPTVERALETIAKDAAISVAVLDVKLGEEMAWPVVEALRRRGVRHVFATGYASGDIPPIYRDAPLFRKPLATPALIEALLRLRRPVGPT